MVQPYLHDFLVLIQPYLHAFFCESSHISIFFGPYRITMKMEVVDYELALAPDPRVHLLFMYSC